MEHATEKKVTETDYFIIKLVLILFISIITLLLTLIIFKIAIEKKIIFKLSDYF